ncbi:hypothetical protein ACJ73_03489 [Blastomyces percursus]|uniref:Uncharacterized protein n=1 Tax=Blastomyces percursus TaxID=1658174 RepID=A0A1J9Q9E2_9EURO|nr:hypothetical protein ACJ73_03489 [Blastomyces percursus]
MPMMEDSYSLSLVGICILILLPPSRRYYGDPVQAHATLSEAATRVTIDEFGVLVLSTIITGWGASGRNSVEAAS